MGQGAFAAVLHCFTGGRELARRAVALGHFISFTGILTFKTAAELREVARFVPLDRCLIETDSPYLAPVPHRGKTNTPAYVLFVARQLAEIKGCREEEIEDLPPRLLKHAGPSLRTIIPREPPGRVQGMKCPQLTVADHPERGRSRWSVPQRARGKEHAPSARLSGGQPVDLLLRADDRERAQHHLSSRQRDVHGRTPPRIAA